MSETANSPSEPGKLPAESAPEPEEAWKSVVFGQIAQDLVPYHPDPPEAAEDELTREALADPEAVSGRGGGESAPTLWRVLVVLAVAVAALAIVFWKG